MSDVVNMKGQPVEPTEVMPHDQWVELVRAHMKNAEIAFDTLDVRVRNLEKREAIQSEKIQKIENAIEPIWRFWRRFF